MKSGTWWMSLLAVVVGSCGGEVGARDGGMVGSGGAPAHSVGAGGTATTIIGSGTLLGSSGGAGRPPFVDAGFDYGCIHAGSNRIPVNHERTSSPGTESDAGEADAGSGSCFVNLPDTRPYRFDPRFLNVDVETPSGISTLYPVASSRDCDETGGLSMGWYYDDPVHPKRVEFCSETCREIGELGDVVGLEFGCANPPRLQ